MHLDWFDWFVRVLRDYVYYLGVCRNSCNSGKMIITMYSSTGPSVFQGFGRTKVVNKTEAFAGSLYQSGRISLKGKRGLLFVAHSGLCSPDHHLSQIMMSIGSYGWWKLKKKQVSRSYFPRVLCIIPSLLVFIKYGFQSLCIFLNEFRLQKLNIDTQNHQICLQELPFPNCHF